MLSFFKDKRESLRSAIELTHHKESTYYNMIIINQTAELPYSPTQVFEVVNNVQAYPEFLPFCKKGMIKTLETDKVVEGSLTLGGLGFSETVKTQNTLIKPHQINMRLLEGPLNYLEGNWTFSEISPGKTQAKLHIKLDFKYPWLERITKPMFKKVTQEALAAFVKRVEICYKTPRNDMYV